MPLQKNPLRKYCECEVLRSSSTPSQTTTLFVSLLNINCAPHLRMSRAYAARHFLLLPQAGEELQLINIWWSLTKKK